MTTEKRVCIFCGKTPLTREHHPPQWIEQFCPAVIATSRWFHQAGKPLQQRGKGSRVALAEIKHFCESCNSGWMAELESKTKPILGPMVAGKACVLDLDARTTLATWLVKSALTVCVSASREEATKFRSVYDNLYQTRRVGPTSRIFAAKCATSRSFSTNFSSHILTEVRSDGSSEVVGHGFVYIGLFGHFVATVADFPIQFAHDGWPGAPVVGLWPGPRTARIRVEWPPLPEVTVQAIARAWQRKTGDADAFNSHLRVLQNLPASEVPTESK